MGATNSTTGFVTLSPKTPVARSPWGQRARARIGELKGLCEVMAQHSNAAPKADVLSALARDYLQLAETFVVGRRRLWGWFGASIDAVETSINAAYCLMLRYISFEDLAGRLPDLLAVVQEHLLPRDPRRIQVEQILRRVHSGQQHLNEQDRESVATAVRAALSVQEREFIQVRSFRNLVYGIAVCLALLAVTIGVATYRNPGLLPVCFQPADQVVCPQASAAFNRGQDLNAQFVALASRWDYVVIEMVGLVAAAVAAAATMRRIKGTSVPYSVPLALAVLKLPTGALTAVVGLLLMRGQFVPGLSALDTSAQIVAWAAVFGYAQQVLTRLVDERGQAILNSVTGPENPAGVSD